MINPDWGDVFLSCVVQQNKGTTMSFITNLNQQQKTTSSDHLSGHLRRPAFRLRHRRYQRRLFLTEAVHGADPNHRRAGNEAFCWSAPRWAACLAANLPITSAGVNIYSFSPLFSHRRVAFRRGPDITTLLIARALLGYAVGGASVTAPLLFQKWRLPRCAAS